MATVAHCLFCFDVLSASLEKRKCLSLAQVQDLWTAYNSSHDRLHPTGESLEKKKKTKANLHDGNHESEDAAEEFGLEKIEREQKSAAARKSLLPSASDLRLPGISRLRGDLSGSGSGSGSSSSSSSTPSTLSTASSRSALTDSSSSSSTTTANNPSSSSSISSASASISSASPVSSAPRRPYVLGGKREDEYPLFVTWNTISSRGNKSLRGCIGTFDATELSHGLKAYALTAAFDDTRFPPISLSELPSLSLSVTFLVNFTPTSDPFDWTIGTHGLRLSFSYHARRYHATYLPDVAEEQGWTQEETLISLMRKAGWTGRSSEWRKVADLKVVRYEGTKASVAFGVYEGWRGWVEGSRGGSE